MADGINLQGDLLWNVICMDLKTFLNELLHID